ncbi:MAG: 2-succinyl-6-hydroxy-2,4-cyclohexadiene-1-carboxylate synthase [Myxococcota bacterium]|nr:2-succinyl-6-hydroxy-2,4-cyclohexadiene-1-carboxylate synthase [Myxococcota bacterium]
MTPQGPPLALHGLTASPPAIVALHGFGGSARDFEAFKRAFPLDIVTIDLLGHGDSPTTNDPIEYAVDRQVFRLRQCMMTTKPVLMGYSMGGRLALHYALAHPETVSALILIGAHAGIADTDARQARQRWDDTQAQALDTEGVQRFMKRWARLPLMASQQRRMAPHAYAALQTRRAAGHGPALAASLRGFGSGRMPSCWHRLRHLRLPTLLVVGSDDEKYRGLNAQMAGLIPNNAMVVIPAAGHAPHLENPSHTATQVTRFLAALHPNTLTEVGIHHD